MNKFEIINYFFFYSNLLYIYIYKKKKKIKKRHSYLSSKNFKFIQKYINFSKFLIIFILIFILLSFLKFNLILI
jgi:hypothetical protein